MHRFLVVAPLKITAAELQLDDDVQPTTPELPEASRMYSQEHYDAGQLTQVYVRRSGQPHDYPDTYSFTRDGASVQLDNIRLVVAADAVLLHADAQLATPGSSVPAVERLLSDAVGGYVREHIRDDLEISWVNRTLLATADKVPANWLAPPDDCEQVVLRMDGHSPVLTVGWGNNVLAADVPVTGLVRTRLIEGLTDAQVLWGQLDVIAQKSAELIRAYRAPADGQKRRELATEQIDQLTKDLATHNLYYDELLLNLQGTRKHVAVATLRSWGYPTLLDRVSRRVNEIERVAQQEAENNRRRYQGIVEAVLLAIGLVSLLQLLLALVQTAFSGGEDRVPGGQDRLSIMEFLRRIDLDLAIWLTSAATLLAFVGIVLLKRRG
jgi:hypothetical protein